MIATVLDVSRSYWLHTENTSKIYSRCSGARKWDDNTSRSNPASATRFIPFVGILEIRSNITTDRAELIGERDDVRLCNLA